MPHAITRYSYAELGRLVRANDTAMQRLLQIHTSGGLSRYSGREFGVVATNRQALGFVYAGDEYIRTILRRVEKFRYHVGCLITHRPIR